MWNAAQSSRFQVNPSFGLCRSFANLEEEQRLDSFETQEAVNGNACFYLSGTKNCATEEVKIGRWSREDCVCPAFKVRVELYLNRGRDECEIYTIIFSVDFPGFPGEAKREKRKAKGRSGGGVEVEIRRRCGCGGDDV
jgi:hypothetical protein